MTYIEDLGALGPPGNMDWGATLWPGGFRRRHLATDARMEHRLLMPVLTGATLYENDEGYIVARGDVMAGRFDMQWRMPSELAVHLKAGVALYAGGPGRVEAIDVSGDAPKVRWTAQIGGTPHRMLAAAGRLYVVTEEGAIYAFGAPGAAQQVRRYEPPRQRELSGGERWAEQTAALLEAAKVHHQGYALVLGLGLADGGLVKELLRQSEMEIVAVDEDPDTVAALRMELHEAGLYGRRAMVLQGDPLRYPFSPYMAVLAVSERPRQLLDGADSTRSVEALFRVLRPFGGVACLWDVDQGAIGSALRGSRFAEQGRVEEAGHLALVRRPGAPPGSAGWSHGDANAARTGASLDEMRLPLSVLWFDGRHYWGSKSYADPRVGAGVYVGRGSRKITALDVYTGRLVEVLKRRMR